MQIRSTQFHSKTIIFSLFLLKAALIVTFLSLPRTSHAGFISYITDFIQGTSASAAGPLEESSVNSQNMALLRAATNLDPAPKTTSDLAIVNKSALFAQNGPSGTLAEVEHAPVNTSISLYVVREGDSVATIADIFKVSVNTIILTNNLDKRGTIQPGQNLVILPISGIRYTVKKGDTVASIVKKHGADIAEVLAFNDITADTTLTVGETLLIPDAELAPIQPQAAKSVIVKSSVKGSDAPDYGKYFIRPINGGTRTQGLHGYNGVDIAAPTGTSIYASAAGTVIISAATGWNYGYGSYIVISHPNGTQTLYAHLSKNYMSVGDSVEQGDVIGKVGSTGQSTGPHIHFEIRGAKNPF